MFQQMLLAIAILLGYSAVLPNSAQGGTTPFRLELLTSTPTPGEPVSLLASIPQALPHPGYGAYHDVTVSGTTIDVDLFPVEPPLDRIWPQVVRDLHYEITLENLKAGRYTVAATWHSPWNASYDMTATASFTVVPEPNTVALLGSALAVALAIVRRTTVRARGITSRPGMIVVLAQAKTSCAAPIHLPESLSIC